MSYFHLLASQILCKFSHFKESHGSLKFHISFNEVIQIDPLLSQNSQKGLQSSLAMNSFFKHNDIKHGILVVVLLSSFQRVDTAIEIIEFDSKTEPK